MILPRPIPLLSCLFFLWLFQKIDAVIYSGPKGSGSGKNYWHSQPDFTIQKVSLTQRGYIQFLKYTSKVPPLTDYTFCIWVQSNNLTHNHPLLSYSKHEEERLISVWISDRGENLCLEILGHAIFKEKVNLVENIWNHVCQSWSAQLGSWELYLNGKLKSTGIVPKLTGIPIKGGGDIVVGQEYTDFDKGLDDGIEGNVFGFNFVLSSTLTSAKHSFNPVKLHQPLRRRFDDPKSRPRLRIVKPSNIHQPEGNHLMSVNKGLNSREVLSVGASGFPAPRYFFRRRFTRNIFQDSVNLFNAEAQTSHVPAYNKFFGEIPVYNNEISIYNNEVISGVVSNNDIHSNYKTLGMLLVELSFDCALKKGAPLSGKGVLISWTKSPVRVFGGAILKKISPFCTTLGS